MECGVSTSAFNSPVFEILVGPSAKSFYAHADVLSKSTVLRKEVDGLWKENSEKKIYWHHWTVSAVEKLLEWLYTGDYACPYPIEARKEKSVSEEESCDTASRRSVEFSPRGSPADVPADVAPPVIEEEPVADLVEGLSPVSLPNSISQYGHFSRRSTAVSKARRKRGEQVKALPRLQDLHWIGCRSLEKLSQAEEYDRWTGHQLWTPSELDYEVTFMAHAELYVMACLYMLDDLKIMAWQRLRTVLISIGKPTPASPLMGNLATLAHYAYQETGGKGDGDEEEHPLRVLVSSFAGLYFTSLRGVRFDELMMSKEEADREFVVDLMGKVSQQMAWLLETQEPPSEHPVFKKVTKKKYAGMGFWQMEDSMPPEPEPEPDLYKPFPI